MIPTNAATITPFATPAMSTPSWQQELSEAIRDPKVLYEALGLPVAHLTSATAANQASSYPFPLRVPWSFVSRMQKGNMDDPLLRQVLPIEDELQIMPGYVQDPVGDLVSQAVPGVLHKYHGRALLVTTGACAVHCRYCFRREYPYAEASLTTKQFKAALDYLRADASITEVLLSGGDPLSLTDNKLQNLIEELNDIPHIQRIRLHTRQVIVLPNRVTPELLTVLSASRVPVVMVVHVNHANELDAATTAALQRIKPHVAALLNQSVLLQGVNGDEASLVALSEALFAAGVLPYYLNQLDRVQGAAHFQVSDERALQLMTAVRTRLPGYLVPKLVQEIAGQPYKTPM